MFTHIKVVNVFISNVILKEVVFDKLKQILFLPTNNWLSNLPIHVSNASWFQLSHGPDGWVNEFTTAREQSGSVDDQWVSEFSKLHVQDWADEFGRQVGEGILGENSADNWADAYDE